VRWLLFCGPSARYGWRCDTRLRTHFGSSFAEGLDGSDQSEKQHLVGVEISALPPPNKPFRSLCRFNHVTNARGVITLHIEPQRSKRPHHGSSGLSPGPCASRRADRLQGLTMRFNSGKSEQSRFLTWLELYE
jgi:hypothetical protein